VTVWCVTAVDLYNKAGAPVESVKVFFSFFSSDFIVFKVLILIISVIFSFGNAAIDTDDKKKLPCYLDFYFSSLLYNIAVI